MNALGRLYQAEDLERPSIRRGGLTLIFDPLELWLGDVQVRLSPLECELMLILMQRGRAHWAMVDDVLRGGESSATIRDVLVHRIRRKFLAAGGGDPIETVRGWGLKLRVPPDHGQSTSVWIGTRTPAF
ncbi:hypothetical protein [Sphingomonas sp.]|jgi:DNA-binding response OmpR family regulator|uniref:hypothetical protein n=1 Tax=Sphingomonas sp. TaxID=28214 RepID=UPI002EDB6353